MANDKINQLQQGLSTAFVDASVTSNLAYKPQFISNNYKMGHKVLSSVKDELLACSEFAISVAFVNMNGITPLLQILKELEAREITGRILTTNYLNFSEPKALEKLSELSNVTLKVYDADKARHGFHTKGYIFKNEDIYRIIVGSSNMTSSALTTNKEWNTKIISTEQGEVTRAIVTEFDELWNSSYTREYEAFIEEYRVKYDLAKKQREIAKQEEIPSVDTYKLQPNSMQISFISNLRKIRELGEKRPFLFLPQGQVRHMLQPLRYEMTTRRKHCFLCIGSRLQNKRLLVIKGCLAIRKFLGFYLEMRKIMKQTISFLQCK